MKEEFEMTNEELDLMKSIASDNIPVMKIGNYWSGIDKQERANKFWKDLGDKYGFVWDTVEGVSGKGYTFFKAVPSKTEMVNSKQEIVNN